MNREEVSRHRLPLAAAAATAWLVCAPTARAAEPSAPPAAAPPPPRVIYAGDMAFPPYEYLDPSGQPGGLNVEMLRLLAPTSTTRWWSVR